MPFERGQVSLDALMERGERHMRVRRQHGDGQSRWMMGSEAIEVWPGRQLHRGSCDHATSRDVGLIDPR